MGDQELYTLSVLLNTDPSTNAQFKTSADLEALWVKAQTREE